MRLSPNNLCMNFSVQRLVGEDQHAVCHVLTRPCLRCFVASASTWRTSVMTFTMISDIIGDSGIFSV